MIDSECHAVLLNNEAKEAGLKLVDHLTRTGVAASCYAYKYRAKDTTGLLEKVQRKRSEKPNYDLTSITDVIGIRLVTLFKGDMTTLFEKLLACIKTNSDDNPFVCADPEEIIVYKGTSALNDFADSFTRIAQEANVSVDVQHINSTAGYSSVHVICRAQHKPTEICTPRLPVSYRFPVEIQIRTVFEDAWGEIDHKHGYIHRTGKSSALTPQGGSVRAHLKVLKDFVDACMDYADCIRRESISVQEVPVPRGQTESVPSDDNIGNRLRLLGLDKAFVSTFMHACSARDDATKDMDNVRLHETARMFSELRARLGTMDTVSTMQPAERTGFYECAMNEALCLLSSGMRQQIEDALLLYRDLDSAFPGTPIVKMRLGQALGDTGQIHEAMAVLRAAEQMSNAMLPVGRAPWPDAMPAEDYRHMQRALPDLLGFNIWRQSLEVEDSLEKAMLFYQALNVAKGPLAKCKMTAEQQHSVQNNLLYYAVGFLFHAAPDDQHRDEVYDFTLEILPAFRAGFGDLSKVPLEELDTLFRTLALVQDHEAESIAALVRNRCLSESGGMVASQRLEIARVAQHYLDNHKLVSV